MSEQFMLFDEKDKSFLLYQFPDRKKAIGKLSYDEKMEWYQTRSPEDMIWLGNSKEFQSFWKWHVVVPLKFKRFYYRVKNGEIFKRYQHITEIKKNLKKYCI